MKMLICHTPIGQIYNIVFDPIPEGMLEAYNNEGVQYLIAETELDGAEVITRYYVDSGDILARPEFDAPPEITMPADGVVHATITLPDPCEVFVDGEPQTVTGGVLELSSDMPAEYLIELRQWPYIDAQIKVIANATV